MRLSTCIKFASYLTEVQREVSRLEKSVVVTYEHETVNLPRILSQPLNQSNLHQIVNHDTAPHDGSEIPVGFEQFPTICSVMDLERSYLVEEVARCS